MKLNPVSFKGIYDIRFPQGTKDEAIEQKCKQIQDYIDENLTKDGFTLYNARTVDWFDYTKSDRKLVDKGIRVASSMDNPSVLCEIFDHIDKKLGQQYINKAKVELILDTQA